MALKDPDPHWPLYCLDSGDPRDERGYRGPFDTLAEASQAQSELHADEDEGNRVFKIRRCRRVRPSEIDRAKHILDDIEEWLNEDAGEGGCPTDAWGNWEDSLVEQGPEADGTFVAWLDANFRTRMCICKPEPEPE